MFTKDLLKVFHDDEEDDTCTRFAHLLQMGIVNKHTHVWEVLETRFPNHDQLLKMYIFGLKPMLHGDLSPPKRPAYPRSRDLGTLRKLTQIVGDSIGDSGTCWPSPRRSGQISGTFRTDFEDVLGRFQGFFLADFGDIPGIYLQS
jgi:hypothetical protein